MTQFKRNRGENYYKKIQTEWLKAQDKHGNLEYPDETTIMSVTGVVFEKQMFICWFQSPL